MAHMDVVDHLRELEEALLRDSVRKDTELVSALLAEDFREFGSSGQVFSKIELLAALQAEIPLQLSLNSFEASLLSPCIALVTYRTMKQIPGLPVTHTLRSSVWMLREDRWQMLFHQGTKIPQPL